MIVAGVDSFLTAATLAAYDRQDARCSRAATQTALFPAKPLVRSCWQRGDEENPDTATGPWTGLCARACPLDSGRPLRADGLVQAVRAALDEAGVALRGLRSSHR